MKAWAITFLVFVLGALLVSPAFAAGQSAMPGQAQSVASQSAGDLLGKMVQSRDGQNIGEITNVVTEPNTGNIAYVIVSYNGKHYPVPFNAVSFISSNEYAINIDKSRFENAPTLAEGILPPTDPQFTSQVHQYYGVAPTWNAAPSGSQPYNPNVPSAGQSGMQGRQLPSSFMSAGMSNFLGRMVQSADGKYVGRITDVVIDPNTHAVAYVIVTDQGKNYPVPFRALSLVESDKFAVNINKDKFLNGPTLAKGILPPRDQQFTSQIHQYYGVAPSFQVQPGAGGMGQKPGMGTYPDYKNEVTPGWPSPGPSSNTPGVPGGSPATPVWPKPGSE